MSRIPDAFIDELLARTDVVEVVGARLALKRKGREYSALCPFHDERTASFWVSPTKQFYHCFGCGAHGTALRFLMEYDKLEFLDAVEELARQAGMEVPRETRQQHARSDFDAMHEVCEAAVSLFEKQLVASAKAQQYLQKRGVDAENRRRFRIGYAPDSWDTLKLALGTDQKRLQLLDRVGLLSTNDKAHSYDKFRDRLIFPISDRRGRTIAFGGRVLDPEASPKYLNSPETPLFHKGRELYGLWQVRQAHAKIPRLVVVEGYMDVVSLFQFGVTTAVATLGTATTPDHAELLFRNCADVYFCFDGDRAGRAAAWKALESVLPRMKEGRQAFFLFLPDGEDPDSLVRREGAAGFERELQAAVPLSEFFFRELGHDVRIDTLDGKSRLAERCKPLLAQIPDGSFRDLMQARLGELTGLGVAGGHAPPSPMRMPPPRRIVHAAPKRSLVRTAIALLLQQPRLAADIAAPYPFAGLRQPGVELLIELLAICATRPGLTSGALLEHFSEREEGSSLRKLALQEFPGDETTWHSELQGALEQLTRQTLRQRLDDLRAKQAADGLDENEKRELLELLRARVQ